MAEARGDRKSWLWMIVAAVATLGLMLWLGFEAGRYRDSVAVVEDTTSAAEESSEFDEVEITELAGDLAGYQGRPLFVSGVSVGSQLGNRAFLSDTGTGVLILVVFLAGVDSPSFQEGDTLGVWGTLEPLTAADVGEWIETGVVAPQARQQLDPNFIRYYLGAERASPEEEGAEGGEGEG